MSIDTSIDWNIDRKVVNMGFTKQYGIVGVMAAGLLFGACSEEQGWAVPEVQKEGYAFDRAPIDRNSVRAPSATGTELLVNGDFETGDLSGWQAVALGDGFWAAFDELYIPLSGLAPEPPFEGAFGAISDPGGPGDLYLSQDVTLGEGTATLSFAEKIDNLAEEYDPQLQFYTVEIVEPGGEPGQEPVLATLFSTQPGDPAHTPYTVREFDISAFAGQTIRLRFRVHSELFFFNVRLDNVSIIAGDGGGGGGGGGGDLGCTVALEGNPGSASVGAPFVLEMDLANTGSAFGAAVGVFLLMDGDILPLVSEEGVSLAEGFAVVDFPIYSTLALPSLPSSVGFLVTVYDEQSGGLLCSDVTVVGVDATVSASEEASMEELADSYARSLDPADSVFGAPLQQSPLDGAVLLPFGN